MSYAPFYEKFPDLAQTETRRLTVLNLPDLPPGEYVLLEAYCDEPGCDCRRVFFHVIEWRTQQSKAVIAYGWESGEFYEEWFGMSDPENIRELRGPALNPTSVQSPLAPALLNHLGVILHDRQYVERLKGHYALFKAAVDRKTGPTAPTQKKALPPSVSQKLKKRRR